MNERRADVLIFSRMSYDLRRVDSIAPVSGEFGLLSYIPPSSLAFPVVCKVRRIDEH